MMTMRGIKYHRENRRPIEMAGRIGGVVINIGVVLRRDEALILGATALEVGRNLRHSIEAIYRPAAIKMVARNRECGDVLLYQRRCAAGGGDGAMYQVQPMEV